MKTLTILLFILVSGSAALANSNDNGQIVSPQIEGNVQIEFSEMVTLLDSSNTAATNFNEVKSTSENEVARLYKFKNSRILKALSFKTKRNKSKKA